MVKDPTDLRVEEHEDAWQVTGPSGGAVLLRLHERKRVREPECVDRITFEVQGREPSKKRWNRLAFLHGRDSYEDEYRYVLEENEVRDDALARLVATLGTSRSPMALVELARDRATAPGHRVVLELLLDGSDGRFCFDSHRV